MQGVRKMLDQENIVLFVALVPDVEDRNGDIISAEEISKTAHEFMRNIQNKEVNINHEDGTTLDEFCFVENYILIEDLTWGENIIPKGSRIVGIQFSEEMYEDIKAGEFIGISIEGEGVYLK